MDSISYNYTYEIESIFFKHAVFVITENIMKRPVFGDLLEPLLINLTYEDIMTFKFRYP
jgi:hypothetical protein